ncbi:hypothetical protein G7046_g9363 [Stylonectria norvegica]|nr:hypothetical protein G7046_g9363 [Stylonectria norvegica]
MSLVSRITLHGDDATSPEDYLSSSLGVIFPDDVTNQHGDAEHSLLYTSPHLPKPLLMDLADPVAENDRKLFSHYLWNASLLLAEFIEADSLSVALEKPRQAPSLSFDVAGLDILELGAGTALPSIMAGLLGARRVVVTDYPAPSVLATLETNVTRSIKPALSPRSTAATSPVVAGHTWGELDDAFSQTQRQSFDRIIAADCLWMPWEHAKLHQSISFFLKPTAEARCWVVAGFHTGRVKMRDFFDAEALRREGLEVEHLWERDCNGEERAWDPEREDDQTERKRWLVVLRPAQRPRHDARVPLPHQALQRADQEGGDDVDGPVVRDEAQYIVDLEPTAEALQKGARLLDAVADVFEGKELA